MAPLPVNNTNRLWVDYTDGTNEHSLMFRYQTGELPADVMAVADDFLAAVSAITYQLTVTAARISAEGTNFSLPIG